jgi:superfamily II RNA helicase
MSSSAKTEDSDLKCMSSSAKTEEKRTMSTPYLTIIDVSKTPEQIPANPYSFPLDPFQKHALCGIAKDEHVLVCAKTGSGKTLVGEYQIYHSLAKGKRVFYTTPIKSLSNQKFHDLKHQFKEATVGIMTGDIKFCPDAQIVIMTTEILRNLLYKKGTTTEHLGLTATISMDDVDAVIFDECHYINDKDRGKVWEETMILLPNHINMVMLSATLDRPEYLAGWLGSLKQRMVHLIVTDYRIVPLTHYVLEQKEEEYKMITIMDAKEVYYESAYQKWIGNTHAKQREADRYARNIAESKADLGPKVSVSGFVHNMNRVVEMLQKEELLPALFFVLSRKQCEQYADKVEHTLLDSSDIAAVKHIISFHLHRHMKDLETVPQYHQIYKLLTRGIAFHHSGLLPILKEITEILFSKGYVKLMFCTETFAVGLNMPTKTVLFAGLKKFDETLGGMRMLRHDEYIQMAGRAGRRGKDDKGVVIYMPDREAATPSEMYTMMKGARPPIHSRMDFHYDFILKSIQSSGSNSADIQSSGSNGADIQSSGSSQDTPKWLQIMENSYWFEQRKKELEPIRKNLADCNKRIKSLQLGEPYLSEITKRLEIEQKMKTAVNAAKKELQKQLDSVKNRQLGPKWNQAFLDVQTLNKLTKERDEIDRELSILEDHRQYIQPFVDFLYQAGYICHNDIMKLTQADLTIKGVLATEVNEGHPILMTEMYTRGWCHHLSGEDLVCFLSCFQESKEKDVHRQLDVSSNLLLVLQQLQYLADESIALEKGATLENYWNFSTEMMEPMKLWMGTISSANTEETQPEHASVICAKYELFEGNFIRSIMKISNMLNEWLSMATYCQHTDQIEKITSVQQRLIRDLVVSDSLYLRL